MTRLALRAYTVGAAVLCGGAIAYTLDQQHTTQRWQAEAQSWQRVARRVVIRDQALVRRYNRLVRDTNRRAALQIGTQATAYRTSTATTPAALSAAPAPTTRTS